MRHPSLQRSNGPQRVWTCADEVVLHRPLLTRTHTRATHHSADQTPKSMRRLACAAPLQRALARRLAGGPITHPTRNRLPPRRPLSASSNPNPNPSSSSNDAGAAATEGGAASGGAGAGGPRPIPPRKGPKVVRCCLLCAVYIMCASAAFDCSTSPRPKKIALVGDCHIRVCCLSRPPAKVARAASAPGCCRCARAVFGSGEGRGRSVLRDPKSSHDQAKDPHARLTKNAFVVDAALCPICRAVHVCDSRAAAGYAHAPAAYAFPNEREQSRLIRSATPCNDPTPIGPRSAQIQERGRRGIADTPTKNELLWRKITDTMICVGAGSTSRAHARRGQKWIGRLAYEAFDRSVRCCVHAWKSHGSTKRQPSSLFECARLLVEASKSKANQSPCVWRASPRAPPGSTVSACSDGANSETTTTSAWDRRGTHPSPRIARRCDGVRRKAASQQGAGLSANWCDRSSMTMLVRLRLIVWCPRFGSGWRALIGRSRARPSANNEEALTPTYIHTTGRLGRQKGEGVLGHTPKAHS